MTDRYLRHLPNVLTLDGRWQPDFQYLIETLLSKIGKSGLMNYPYEREVEYYLSRAIEMDFVRRGYQVLPIPNSQYIEKQIPADHLFFASGIFKVFGLQYKRLKESPDHWSIDTAQLRQLQHFDWLFYALPEARSLADLLDHGVLERLKLVRPRKIDASNPNRKQVELYFVKNPKTHYSVPTLKWDTLVDGVLDCYFGIHATSVADLLNKFNRAEQLTQRISELLAVSRGETRVVLRERFFSDSPPD